MPVNSDLSLPDPTLAEWSPEQLDAKLVALATDLGRDLVERELMVRTAESCTGGAIARALTETAGSSAWFDCAFVTYTNDAKMHMLAVDSDMLDQYGAVSEPVAAAMARGALVRQTAGLTPCVSVAVTGVAGPGGGSPDKPVGTVCFGWSGPDDPASAGRWPKTTTVKFDGDRSAVRLQTAIYALQQIRAFWL